MWCCFAISQRTSASNNPCTRSNGTVGAAIAVRSSIEEMARLYAAELVRFRPDGDIRLGGHCIGGLIAIEVAGILRAMNRVVVDPLIITDAPNLAASTHRDAGTSGHRSSARSIN